MKPRRIRHDKRMELLEHIDDDLISEANVGSFDVVELRRFLMRFADVKAQLQRTKPRLEALPLEAWLANRTAAHAIISTHLLRQESWRHDAARVLNRAEKLRARGMSEVDIAVDRAALDVEGYKRVADRVAYLLKATSKRRCYPWLHDVLVRRRAELVELTPGYHRALAILRALRPGLVNQKDRPITEAAS